VYTYIVEVVVGSCQLLEHLKRDTQKRAICHPWTGEDLVPRVIATTSTLGFHFEFNLSDLALHLSVILVHAVGERNGLASVVNLAFAVLPARRLLLQE
jgi:hypothetical protein